LVIGAGCLLAPVVQHQVPESIGRGNVRFGIAGGGGFTSDQGSAGEALGGWRFASADAWIDAGLRDRTDLRVRLSNQFSFGSCDGADCDHAHSWLPGIELQAKRTSDSGNSAFLVGTVNQLMVGIRDEDHATSVGYGGSAIYVGGVFGFLPSGGVRIVVATTLAAGGAVWAGAFLIQPALSLGLEIPVTDRLSIRPEVAGMATVGWFDDRFETLIMAAAFGLALEF
jgi:hypothetical protein